jgi:hypothetical protein
MTAHSATEIVFRRKVRAAWLGHGLALAADGVAWEDAKASIASLIAEENNGSETVRKVLTHIRRVWFAPPIHCAALHAQALELSLNHRSIAASQVLNWGMVLAAYPFLGNLATALGRLVKLQQAVHMDELQNRLRGQFGEREHVSRIVRFDMSSFTDWGILKAGKQPGIYLPEKQVKVKDEVLLAWLAEAIMLSTGRTQMTLSELSNHPALFPFAPVSITSPCLAHNTRLRLERQSFNEQFVFCTSTTTVAHGAQQQQIQNLKP